MKRLREGFRTMNTVKKIEAVAAVILTLAIIAGVPVLAWLTTSTKVEVLTKVKQPTNLDIRAGNYDPIINFDLRDIDIETPDHVDAVNNKASKYYVFSVSAGSYKIPYIIQVAHTTNIPFTYKLYKATRLDKSASLENILYTVYHRLNESAAEGTPYKIEGENLLVNTLNGDSSQYGRQLGLGSGYYYGETYLNTDTPQIYAVPVYHQTGTITWDENQLDIDEPDYYVLELEWDTGASAGPAGFTQWNKAVNNKETDIIYISAAKATE